MHTGMTTGNQQWHQWLVEAFSLSTWPRTRITSQAFGILTLPILTILTFKSHHFNHQKKCTQLWQPESNNDLDKLSHWAPCRAPVCEPRCHRAPNRTAYHPENMHTVMTTGKQQWRVQAFSPSTLPCTRMRNSMSLSSLPDSLASRRHAHRYDNRKATMTCTKLWPREISRHNQQAASSARSAPKLKNTIFWIIRRDPVPYCFTPLRTAGSVPWWDVALDCFLKPKVIAIIKKTCTQLWQPKSNNDLDKLFHWAPCRAPAVCESRCHWAPNQTAYHLENMHTVLTTGKQQWRVQTFSLSTLPCTRMRTSLSLSSQPGCLASRKHAHSYDNRKATMTCTNFLTEHLAVHPYAKLDVTVYVYSSIYPVIHLSIYPIYLSFVGNMWVSDVCVCGGAKLAG